MKLASYIYSFHVPLFFIISGFLLQRSGLQKKPSEFIRSKFLQLAVPYFFFSAIEYMYWFITRQAGLDLRAQTIPASTPLDGTILAIRNSNFMVHNGALWFICALLVAEIAFYFLHKLVKGDKIVLGIILTVSVIVGTFYATFVKVPLPWSVDAVPMVIVFLGLGYFLGEYYPKWEQLKDRRYIVPVSLSGAFILNIVFWFLNKTPMGRVDMFYGIYGSIPLYFLAALFGSIATMIFFESIISKVKTLSYVGKNSLTIYALHQTVIFGIIGLILQALLRRSFPFLQETSLEKLGNGVVYLILTLLILTPIVWLLNKYLSSFVGKGGKYVMRGWLKRKLVYEPTGLD